MRCTPRRHLVPLRGLLSFLRVAPVVVLAALVAGLVEAADLSLLPLFGMHAGAGERSSLLWIAVFSGR